MKCPTLKGPFSNPGHKENNSASDKVGVLEIVPGAVGVNGAEGRSDISTMDDVYWSDLSYSTDIFTYIYHIQLVYLP